MTLTAPAEEEESRRYVVQNTPVWLHSAPPFNPTPFSMVAATSCAVRPGDRVLDAGAGGGILAVVAARLGASRVHAVEKEPFGCELTARNAAANGVADRIEVLAARLEELEWPRVDTVLSNPPTMPAADLVPPMARAGDADHLSFVRALLRGATEALRSGGTLQLAISSLVREDTDALLAASPFEPVYETQFILPFRPYYYECYSAEQIQSFIERKRAVRTGRDALAEVVAFLHLRRA